MPQTSSTDMGLSADEIEAVRKPLSQASLLPAKVYTDPAIFAMELTRVFRSSWVQLCHVSQIAGSGQFVTKTIAGEAVIAVRNREGGIKVLSNVCRHRNMLLAAGAGTCRAGRIICPYHGWAYGLDGQLLTAPHMEQAEDFVKGDVKLPTVRSAISAIWHGFVFVNLDGKATSLAEQLAGMESEIGPYKFEDMEYLELRRRDMPWNWKISLENFSEAYHQPLVHPRTADHDFPATSAEYQDVSGPYGLFWIYQRNKEIFPTFFPPTRGVTDRMLRSATIFNVYPSFHGLTDAATPLMLGFNIKSQDQHELVWSVLLPKGTLEKPGADQEVSKFKAFIEPILEEDVAICTGVSQGVSSSLSGQGRLSHMEKTVHQFHNWWLDKMLAHGEV